MRTRFVMRHGKLVRKDQADRLYASAGPMVIGDDLGADLEHHGFSDGRRTSSKSQFRRWTKDAGLVEKGNDRQRGERILGSPTQDVVRDVALATQMVKAGYRPKPIRQFEE